MDFPYTTTLEVEPHLSGVRIDTFLSRHFRNYTSYRMQRLVAAGQVQVDGQVAASTQRVFSRQQVCIRLIEPPDKLIAPEPIAVPILFEDDWLVVVNKPPGLIAHPVGRFQSGTLSNALQHHLDRQTGVRGLLRPGIVHRLDRMTSGVMVVTKHHLAHRNLSIHFQEKRIAKAYLAIVEGHVGEDRGTIALPIGRLPRRDSILMSARADAIRVKPARTGFEVLDRFADTTLVRAKPYTGRLHQIRVHFATLGHPVVGDEYYAAFGRLKVSAPRAADASGLAPVGRPDTQAVDAQDAESEGRHLLHAEQLAFAHPMTDTWSEFTAPLPDDMRAWIERRRSPGTR